ncbi:MAG TPA: hypothetical protein VGI81_29510 [Tepidisphaeraceae bacterium]|jgi:hypothetical protein
MKSRLAVIIAVVLLWVGTPAFAHRLDEYLQATTISLGTDRIAVRVCLTPGVDVFRAVLADIDADGDGVISEAERQAYARRVLHDLSLTLDGNRLPLRLVSSTFATIEEMKEGLGDIVLNVDAEVPPGGANRTLVFENQHQSRIAVYMVNCLLPDDPDIRVIAQSRNYEQSFYQLDYVQAGIRSTPPTPAPKSASWSTFRLFLGADGLVVFGWLAFLWQRRRAGRT